MRQSLYDANRIRGEVIVLSLGVDELSEPARLIDHTHRMAVVVEVGRFEHHVLAAACLDGFKQLVRVLQRTERGWDGARHMLAVFEDVHAVPSMAGSVRGHKHCLERVVLHQFFQRGIRLFASARLSQRGTPVGKQIADRRDFHVRVILEAEGRTELTDAESDNAHADLAVRNRLPPLRSGRVGRRLLEALDGFFLSQPGTRQTQSSRAETNSLQK